jgi:hypothetical protein
LVEALEFDHFAARFTTSKADPGVYVKKWCFLAIMGDNGEREEGDAFAKSKHKALSPSFGYVF